MSNGASEASDYYGRSGAVHLDGTPIFKTAEDERNEQSTARLIEDQFHCSLRPFGCLSPIDWFAERDGRLVGVLELKARTHASDKYPTVFLNVRKWLALLLAANGLSVPALFVVRFTDCVRYILVSDIDASKVRIGGTKCVVKSRSDIEPVIEVPVGDMREIASQTLT